MRRVSGILLAGAIGGAFACSNRANVQCATDPNCDLTTGGVCAAAGTGNHWCAYPDPTCPSGLRFSNQDVGDGVGGACVAQLDGGIPSDGGGGPFASCLALPHTCGASGTDDCCNSLAVMGGTFFRGNDAGGVGDMTAPATVGAYRLDKYEVTVGRFRAFVAAGLGTQATAPQVAAGTHPNIAGSGWQSAWNANLAANTSALTTALKCNGGAPTSAVYATWTDTPGNNENRPINCATWYEAMAFCAWDGGYLPTLAEREYAASGGDQQRAYPWSSPANSLTLDGAHASYSCLADGSQAGDCAPADIAAVGSKPNGDGRWGQSDLAGNVAEWTLDTTGPYPMPCNNCAQLGVNADRVILGGHYIDLNPSALRSSQGSYAPDALRSVRNGLRCARAP